MDSSSQIERQASLKLRANSADKLGNKCLLNTSHKTTPLRIITLCRLELSKWLDISAWCHDFVVLFDMILVIRNVYLSHLPTTHQRTTLPNLIRYTTWAIFGTICSVILFQWGHESQQRVTHLKGDWIAFWKSMGQKQHDLWACQGHGSSRKLQHTSVWC